MTSLNTSLSIIQKNNEGMKGRSQDLPLVGPRKLTKFMDRSESFRTFVRSGCARLQGRSGNELLRPWTQCVPSPEIRKATRPQVSQKTRLDLNAGEAQQNASHSCSLYLSHLLCLCHLFQLNCHNVRAVFTTCVSSESSWVTQLQALEIGIGLRSSSCSSGTRWLKWL